MTLAAAGHQELRQQDGGQDHRRAEVALEDDEQGHESKQRKKWHDPVFKRAEPFAVTLQPEGHEDNGRDFSELGRLHLQGPELEPATSAVDLDADRLQVAVAAHHQRDGQDPQRPGEQAQAMVIDVGCGPEQDKAQRQPDQLPLEVIGGVVEPEPALHLGGGEHHHQAESGQGTNRQQEGAVASAPEHGRREPPAHRRRLERCQCSHPPSSCSTVDLKRRPRSS